MYLNNVLSTTNAAQLSKASALRLPVCGFKPLPPDGW